MKQLLNELKTNGLKNLYLLHGEERYLIRLYENKIRNNVIPDGMEAMNRDIFEGKVVTAEQISFAADTLPFLNDRRLVIVRESGLFAPGRKDETDRTAVCLASLPETTLLLFVEPDNQVDKRNKLYKKVTELGRAVEFKTPTDKELVAWVMRTAKESGKEISPAAATYFIDTVSDDMTAIENEIQKLIAYTGGEKEIQPGDIAEVCSKSLEARVFDLVDAVGNRKTETAFSMFSHLMLMKESPVMIISLMARQFRLILQCRDAEAKKTPRSEMAALFGIRSFTVPKYLDQGKNFTEEQLLAALRECLDADLNIKTGKMADKLAAELLIARFGVKKEQG